MVRARNLHDGPRKLPAPCPKRVAKLRDHTVENLARNLTHLLDETGWSYATVSEKTGHEVSPKTIGNMANGVGASGIDVVETVAAVFGLEGWHLIMPNLIGDLTSGSTIRKMYEDYMASDEEGRRHIERVAERQRDLATPPNKVRPRK